LDQISHGDLGESILVAVLVVDGLVVLSNLLKTQVLAPGQLVRKNDGAISTTTLRSSLEGPGTGIMETDAHGIAGPSCAAASLTPETVLKLVRDVLPHTTGIALASLRVHGRAAKVTLTACGVGASLEDLLDVTSNCSERLVGDGFKITKKGVSIKAVASPATLTSTLASALACTVTPIIAGAGLAGP
jgi:hypothetical protein